MFSNQPFAQYSLTRFLLMYLIREALEVDKTGKLFCENPSNFINQNNGRSRLVYCVDKTATALARLLDNEVKRRNEDGYFDYKRELKNRTSVHGLRSMVISSYQIIVDYGTIKPFSQEWLESESVV